LEVAVAATAVVHLANNAVKGWLLKAWADWAVVLRFGSAAMVAALAGAAVLLFIPPREIASYAALGATRTVTLLGVVLGGLILVFALFDLVPALRRLAVDRRYLVAGGAASGFFGGLSGHQGALRSVFLTKLDFDARTYAATGTFCAILVDVARILVYALGAASLGFARLDGTGHLWLVGAAIAVATAGAVVGRQLIGTITIGQVRWLVGALLLASGVLIAVGWV
jgi:hypothetical protein